VVPLGLQGMNVLCGLFLFVMPEMDAFFSFNTLLTRHCPGYITANLDGVHVGCDLVDRCLALVGHTSIFILYI
jgi:cell cycle arrest protein BUB2